MAVPILSHPEPESTEDQLVRVIRELSESQQRHMALLRGLLAFAAPMPDLGMVQRSTIDNCDCEICGQPVAGSDMAPFPKRHGAVIHVNCFSTQMETK